MSQGYNLSHWFLSFLPSFFTVEIPRTIRLDFRIGIIIKERFVDAFGDVSIPKSPIRCNHSSIIHVYKVLANARGIGTLYKCPLFSLPTTGEARLLP